MSKEVKKEELFKENHEKLVRHFKEKIKSVGLIMLNDLTSDVNLKHTVENLEYLGKLGEALDELLAYNDYMTWHIYFEEDVYMDTILKYIDDESKSIFKYLKDFERDTSGGLDLDYNNRITVVEFLKYVDNLLGITENDLLSTSDENNKLN